MYINIFCDRKSKTTHLWDDETGYSSFPTLEYAYRRKTGGKYVSLYGDELEKITTVNENEVGLFESDIQPELKTLLDLYPNKDEPSKGHRIVIIDIETSTEGGFPNVEKANRTVTAIALYDQVSSRYHSFILDPDAKVSNSVIDDVHVYSYKSEERLLLAFLNKWEEIQPTIVSGWNIDTFDIPYIFNRITVVLGKNESRRLSPIKMAYWSKYRKRMVVAGISFLDYLDLYKKFLGVMKSSYTLGNVAKDEELKNQKLTYKGNLNDLYVSDIHRFVEYNLVDVKIVVELDAKYDFIGLAQSVCHKGHVPYEWFQMSSRWIDGAILDYLHNVKHQIAPNKPVGGKEEYDEMEKEGDDGFTGAYVKEPVVGLYDWVCSADITSLYPSVIMSLNISSETKISKIEGWNMIKFERGEIPYVKIGNDIYSADDFRKMISGNKFSISSNGVVYLNPIKKIVGKIVKNDV